MNFYVGASRKHAIGVSFFMNHKDSTYRTTFVYVVIVIASRAQTSDTSSVLGWGALAFMAEHVGSREVNEARRPHTCSRPCAFEEKTNIKKNTKKTAPPKSHHESPSSPTTATTSRRRATKYAPRVSPYLPASIHLEFADIGLVQLSQSVKLTNITHTMTATQTDGRTDRQTDRQTDRHTYIQKDRQTDGQTDRQTCLLYTSPSPRD